MSLLHLHSSHHEVDLSGDGSKEVVLLSDPLYEVDLTGDSDGECDLTGDLTGDSDSEEGLEASLRDLNTDLVPFDPAEAGFLPHQAAVLEDDPDVPLGHPEGCCIICLTPFRDIPVVSTSPRLGRTTCCPPLACIQCWESARDARISCPTCRSPSWNYYLTYN